MAPPTAQELFNRNVEYKDTHPPIPSFEELYASGDQAATVAVITCADPRCIPENFLKLNVGEAVILRNAGSNIHEAMRSLIAIDCLIGLKEIMVVNHTDCGATVFRNDSIRTVLKERVPGKNEEVDAMKFGEITTSQEDTVRASIKFLKESPFLRQELKAGTTGYVYDLRKGSLQLIE
ncbi:hypothetical protein H2198_009534 [Neophaeococcomyces mojaviensis]|uniref:Uncharacterized protein n=1 Tax=Neophaeococcomyces mojaviensis TaxID=3383035 RepID=A0ACC2ZU99_9EURO|nr:hypothetical protein H2198_009534 [Knufia sp. JES_112]